MSNLTAIFGNNDEKPVDGDKLLNLYWNRAELKKEFADMRKQQFKLKDKIKQQEGAAARLQQKLDYLEGLLVDPEWAHNVLVFFQLRGLSLRCQKKLARFAEQIKQQREQKQHNSLLVSWNENRALEEREIEQLLGEQQDEVLRLEGLLQSERQRLLSKNGFLRFFRRRSVTADLDELAQQIDAGRLEEQALSEQLTSVTNRKPPDNEGLDIAAKRSINLMILSFAQHIYLHFAEDNFASLLKEASEKSVGAINYGQRQDCEVFLDQIQKRVDRMENSTDFAGVIQARARKLAEIAQYRTDDDALPASASVATVFDIDTNGVVKKSQANLLGENYWGISKVVSR